jgi:hypothetical protein
MELLTAKITAAALKSMAEQMFGTLVKAVVGRPSQGNRTRGVEDAGTREEIRAVVREWIS